MASLPWWLPDRVVALRMWLFARINGDEGIPVPGPLVGVEHFKRVYSHPAANGRSRGAALSDLFWYWLSPGGDIHQEHLEPGERYDEVARTTRRILTMPTEHMEELATRYTAEACSRLLDGAESRPGAASNSRSHTLDEEAGSAAAAGTGGAGNGEDGRPGGTAAGSRLRAVRLRDLMMPIWAGVFSEIVFREPCSPPTRALIVANADDVVTALKGCRLRHMDRRDRLTQYLADHLDQVAHELPAGLSRPEQALYLQGTFFNTAVVQMSEAMAHLLMVLAQHPDLQERLAGQLANLDTGNRVAATSPHRANLPAPKHEGLRLLDHVMDETMRLYPLFGIAHRITSGKIEVDEQTTLPAGSVLCFNYPEFHKTGVAEPERFDPGRWENLSAKEANHIPFGVPANRPCPAWHMAPIAMRAATREILRNFALHTSADHTRSMPNRGPCLLVPRHSPALEQQPPRSPANPQLARTPRLSGSPESPLPGPGRWSRGTRPWRLELALVEMRARDRWEDVWRSLVQLVLGTYMVWEARRQRLCERHFQEHSERHDRRQERPPRGT